MLIHMPILYFRHQQLIKHRHSPYFYLTSIQQTLVELLLVIHCVPQYNAWTACSGWFWGNRRFLGVSEADIHRGHRHCLNA